MVWVRGLGVGLYFPELGLIEVDRTLRIGPV